MKQSPSWRASSWGLSRTLALPLAAIVLLLVLLDGAWVGEDALITFRSIEHWVGGHGLRYNTDERVQSYTHPLWMLLNASLFWFTREISWTTTILGLACSMSAWLVLVWPHRSRPLVALGCVTVPWMSSWCVDDYSTSGFENPLSFVFLALFFRVLLRWQGDQAPPWGPLSLVVALAATTRLDAVLFYLPVLTWLVLVQWRRLRVGPILLGSSPLVAWLGFSLLYYGFALPNTAPAKLSTGFSAALKAWHGAVYLLDFVQRDLVGALLLLGGWAVGGHAAWRWLRGSTQLADRKLSLLAAGGLLYVLYVVKIGGCFLSGRFLAAPVVLAIALLAERLPVALAGANRWGRGRQVAALLVLLAVTGGLYQAGEANRPLAREAMVMLRPVARATLQRDGRWRLSKWAVDFSERGRVARSRAAEGQRASAHTALGFAGIAAGPDALLIDRFALADPLLARLPPRAGISFRAGHARRDLPVGYLHARETGSLDRMEPGMARYYQRLRLVISGPLLSRERLSTIVDFQLGRVQPPTAAGPSEADPTD